VASPAAAAPAVAPSFLDKVQIHGFVSEGGFVSTANDYIGASSRGTLKFFEAGINVTIEPTDRLRAGVQLVSRSVGTLSEELPRLDWALLEYRLQRWLGLRAGVTKIPLGLYNEYVDIDSARAAILMPQSLYPIRNRDALISHTGFSLFGNVGLGPAGELSYQAWVGVLAIPRSALELAGATLDSVDSHYATGGQLFWHPPVVEGLRLGASYMRAVIDFNLTLAADSVTQLVMAGALPAGHDGSLVISQDPTTFWVGSAEYLVGDWLFAAEYMRALKLQKASLPELIPMLDEDSERFYLMVTYRLSSLLELGTYFSVVHADVNDRRGRSDSFETEAAAFQRDVAASVRLDVNEHWLWKLEGHFIDGFAELSASQNPSPKRRWGLFLLRTTVTF
jgi:hypothetical protein